MRRYKQVNITGNNSSNGEDLEGVDLTEGAVDTANACEALGHTERMEANMDINHTSTHVSECIPPNTSISLSSNEVLDP